MRPRAFCFWERVAGGSTGDTLLTLRMAKNLKTQRALRTAAEDAEKTLNVKLGTRNLKLEA
jgi:hypothetical protein